MSDFEALRSRVEEAAEMLASAEADRHRHSESLSDLLGRLERKFDAQREELEFYRQRVEPLEQVNHQLADLMDRLLAMIDGGFGEASVEPLRAAAAAAARLLDGDGEAEPGAVAEDEDEGASDAAGFADSADGEALDADADEQTADPGEAVAVAEADEGAFEDVGMDALAAESEAEAELDADAELPETVVRAQLAMAEGEDDPLAAVLQAIAAGDAHEGAEAFEPAATADPDDVIESMEALARQIAAETAEVDHESGEKVDIRSLLARVEAAVEEVRARVGHEPDAVDEAANDEDDAPPSSAVA